MVQQQPEADRVESVFPIGTGTFHEWSLRNAPGRGVRVGELASIIANTAGACRVLGIDIGEGIVRIAADRHSASGAEFACRSVMDLKETFDLVTMFGTTDYIPPDAIEETLAQLVRLARHEVLVVHSLREVPLDEFLQLGISREIARYDRGWVHPINHLLRSMSFEIEYDMKPISSDSAVAMIRVKGESAYVLTVSLPVRGLCNRPRSRERRANSENGLL
jgi:hypothetical protein